MTQERILELAYDRALELWTIENLKLKKDRENRIIKYREQKYWEELEEINRLLIEENEKETQSKTGL